MPKLKVGNLRALMNTETAESKGGKEVSGENSFDKGKSNDKIQPLTPSHQARNTPPLRPYQSTVSHPLCITTSLSPWGRIMCFRVLISHKNIIRSQNIQYEIFLGLVNQYFNENPCRGECSQMIWYVTERFPE